MLAIADAFDAMTTDSVYRRALSRERAIGELISGSCTQFDPQLAVEFNRMLEERPEMLHGAVVNRWLQQLQPNSGDALWTSPGVSDRPVTDQREGHFFQQLVGNMKDAVVFTDAEGTIRKWNPVMERLTSIASDAIVGQSWSNECVRLRDQDGERSDAACFVRECLASRNCDFPSDADRATGRRSYARTCSDFASHRFHARDPWHGCDHSRPVRPNHHGRAARVAASANHARPTYGCRQSSSI